MKNIKELTLYDYALNQFKRLSKSMFNNILISSLTLKILFYFSILFIVKKKKDKTCWFKYLHLTFRYTI